MSPVHVLVKNVKWAAGQKDEKEKTRDRDPPCSTVLCS